MSTYLRLIRAKNDNPLLIASLARTSQFPFSLLIGVNSVFAKLSSFFGRVWQTLSESREQRVFSGFKDPS